MSGEHAQAQPAVTVIGLGGMGSALARALMLRGCEVVVWNRTPARAAPLVASGARLAGSVAEAVAASPLVVICVLDHAASRSLLASHGVQEKLSGKTIVDLTSAVPEEMAAQQAYVGTHGGHFVAGGILAFPAGIGRMDTVMLYAGDGPAFDEHRSTLAFLGGSLEYLGPDPRAASHAFCTLSMFVEATVGLFLEVSAVARRYGIPMDRFFRLTQIARDTLHGQIRDCADRVLSQQFGGEEASIDLHLHFVQELTATFAKTGIPVKMTEAFMAQLALASARGYGSKDLAAIAAALWAERCPSST
jgi:3-hydroxyisobutyrate dehydrogenase-like beta-hydroxyacid dehydrogenase